MNELFFCLSLWYLCFPYGMTEGRSQFPIFAWSFLCAIWTLLETPKLLWTRAHTHIYIILFYIIIKVAQNNSSGHKSRSAYLILILLTKPMKGWACGSTWHTSTVLFCLHYGKQNSNGCWISTSWNGASLVCRAPESDPWNYLELGESDSKSHVRGVPDHWFWFMWSKKASPGAPIEETISQPRIGPRFNSSKPSWSCCVRQMPSQQFCGADSSCCR